MVAVLIGVMVALLGAWLVLVVALAAARPDGATLANALKVLPDTIRLVRRLATDPELPPSVRRTLWLLGLYLALPARRRSTATGPDHPPGSRPFDAWPECRRDVRPALSVGLVHQRPPLGRIDAFRAEPRVTARRHRGAVDGAIHIDNVPRSWSSMWRPAGTESDVEG